MLALFMVSSMLLKSRHNVYFFIRTADYLFCQFGTNGTNCSKKNKKNETFLLFFKKMLIYKGLGLKQNRNSEFF